MPERERLKPTFLVIGAQKSGTTAAFEYMSAHPGLRAPSKKEINYFLCSSLHALGVEYYESHFPFKDEVEPHVSTFEASPNYLISGEAAARIRAYDPGMKLLVFLRDPAMRAYSAWQMYRRIRKKKPDWFFDWVATCDSSLTRQYYVPRGDAFGESFEDDLCAELAVREKGQVIEMPILRHGLYEEQIRAYREHFPADQMLIESNERFSSDTLAVLGEIEDFVGLERHAWDSSTLQPVFVGQYEKQIPAPAQRLLADFYGERNQRLFAFLNRELPWT
jgi:hypothetical protein